MRAETVPSRVVVGIGDDAAGYAALACAIAEARRNGAELVAVRAWGPPADPASRDGTGSGAERQLRARAAETVAHAFHEAAGGVPRDIEATMQTPEGPPGRALVRLADRPGDLLVVGRSRHRLAHCDVRGSVPDYLMDHAACRVLVPAGSPRCATRMIR